MTDKIEEMKAEIQSVLTLIDIAMMKAKQEADAAGVDVYDLRTPDGRWVMNELIASRMQAYNSLTMLEYLGAVQAVSDIDQWTEGKG